MRYIISLFVVMCCVSSLAAADWSYLFEPPVDYAAGDNPVAIVAADFNDDDSPDIAVANNLSNTMLIYFNDGYGDLTAPVSYPTGTSPTRMISGDIDSDSDIDLIVVNQGSDNLSIFLNVGDGSFAAPILLPVAALPQDVDMDDVDGDGLADLAVIADADNYIYVYIGHGDGTFEPPVTYEDLPHLRVIEVVDFTGDGWPDMIAISQDGHFMVHHNYGDGTFWSYVYPLDYITGVDPNSICALDMNLDGNMDIVISMSGVYNGIAFMITHSDGLFYECVYPSMVTAAGATIVTDLTADGWPDYIRVNESYGLVTPHLGYYNENAFPHLGFSNLEYHDPSLFPAGTDPSDLCATDLDGDGDNDVIVANAGSDDISVLYNGTYVHGCGDANFDYEVSVGDIVYLINYIFKSGAQPEPLCIGDANGDGDINVGDAVYLIVHIFNGGPEPTENCCQ